MEINFFTKDHTKYTSNLPFIENLKKPACASKQDRLLLTTLWYIRFQYFEIESSKISRTNCYFIKSIAPLCTKYFEVAGASFL